jgi:uncharacterized membrane protein
MLGYKVLLGIVASAIALISSVPYLRDILRRKTKPHVFTWLVWGVLTAVVFFAQVLKHGGAGSWVTGFTAFTCFVFAGLALRYGEKDIRLLDWLSLLGACFGLVLWALTSDPLLVVIINTFIDVLGFVPTLRKAYNKPHEETLIYFVFSLLKFSAGIAALESFNLTTVLFPAEVTFLNLAFVVMLLVRRRAVNRLRLGGSTVSVVTEAQKN